MKYLHKLGCHGDLLHKYTLSSILILDSICNGGMETPRLWATRQVCHFLFEKLLGSFYLAWKNP